MNKLLTPNGGMPLHGDDLQWIQDGTKEAIKGLFHIFSSPATGNLILSGCALIDNGGGNYTITEGYVLIAYEVCHVPNHSFDTADLTDSSIKLSVTYDASGLDVFADAVSRDTYEIRKDIQAAGVIRDRQLYAAVR